jgi:hypothetical protein
MVCSVKADIATRNRLDALKGEIRFQMSGWVAPSKAAGKANTGKQ